MPKDYKNIPLFTDLPSPSPEPQGFSPDQMIRCEECLRANPPSRLACLYCGKALPISVESTVHAKPTLRPLEKWEQGYSNILIKPPDELSEEILNQAGSLLRIAAADLTRIIAAGQPLPLARTGSGEEALLIEQSLSALGLATVIVSDESLALEASPPRRLRTVELGEHELALYPTAGDARQIEWSDITLVVTGRLFAKQVEVKERKKQIVDARETTSDEAVLDIHTRKQDGGWRIMANNFDFSCLQERKALIAGENFSILAGLIRERSTAAEHNDSYNSVRRSLELAWPSEQQTSSLGWRRDRAGKYSTSEVAVTSNETQFTRFSRLCHFLKVGAP